jgi:hypothetical protein
MKKAISDEGSENWWYFLLGLGVGGATALLLGLRPKSRSTVHAPKSKAAPEAREITPDLPGREWAASENQRELTALPGDDDVDPP